MQIHPGTTLTLLFVLMATPKSTSAVPAGKIISEDGYCPPESVPCGGPPVFSRPHPAPITPGK
ncbi:hypothetical protein OC835_006367 [Tilletia horrida]|nr:hypothetical protein OC835_006367 [Tilletia horrida]